MMQTPALLSNPAGEPHPLIVLQSRLPLAAWRVSGIPSKTEEFHEGLSRLSHQRGDMVHKNDMLQHGESGYVGALRDISIHFQEL